MLTGTSGRHIVLFHPGATTQGAGALHNTTGVEAVSTADFASGAVPLGLHPDQPIVLPNLAMAIMPASMHPDLLRTAALANAETGIRTIIPEQLVWLAGASGWSPDFLRGYREGMNQLIDTMLGSAIAASSSAPEAASAPAWSDFQHAVAGAATATAADSTWGLRETLVIGSEHTGEGVKVGLLDTGLDLTHPDFQDGRVVATASFVGQPVQDVPTPRMPPSSSFPLGTPGNPGHGTHCTGTACGPESPAGGSVQGRYGVACKAQIVVGKVLANQGVSVGGSILQGIEWAINQGCRVISLSLAGEISGPDPYTQVAELAIQKGVALIAAVGNESNRPGQPGFNPNRPAHIHHVMRPAANIRVMGVGAVNSTMQLAAFSNRGKFPPGGAVDIVGPGMEVFSSLPVSAPSGFQTRYGLLQGTSMATPHVAGIAAMIAQAKPDWGPLDILRWLRDNARTLPGLDPADVGGGLVQAP
jgi:subtilisin family serine protease